MHRTRERTHQHAKDDGHDPTTNESLDGFLGRQLDQGGLTHKESENVRPNVVSNDQRNGQKEPNKSLKDVVDNKVTLTDDQQERHVSPCKLRELEAVVAFLQVRHKEHETYVTCKAISEDGLEPV